MEEEPTTNNQTGANWTEQHPTKDMRDLNEMRREEERIRIKFQNRTNEASSFPYTINLISMKIELN